MSAGKRSASATPQLVPSKKQKTSVHSGSFPSFDDGDVIISIGDLDMRLHCQTLRETCDYFANFDDTFPQRFILKNDEGDSDSPIIVVTHLDEAENAAKDVKSGSSTESKAVSSQTCAVNKAIFALLYKQPITDQEPTDLHNITLLAGRYGCVLAIKDALVITILKANLRSPTIQQDPWTFLNIAYCLEDESIFSEAMVLTVGRDAEKNSRARVTEDAVRDMLANYANKLRAKVEQCWEDMMVQILPKDLSGCLAAVMVYSHFNRELHFALGNALRQEVYSTLKDFYDTGFKKNQFILECVDEVARYETKDHAPFRGRPEYWLLYLSNICRALSLGKDY